MARRRKHSRRYKYGRKRYTARQLRCKFGKRRARSIMRGRRKKRSRRSRRR